VFPSAARRARLSSKVRATGVAVYPPIPINGQKIGANLCPRPTFPDSARGGWSAGTVDLRDINDGGPQRYRLGAFTQSAILLPGVAVVPAKFRIYAYILSVGASGTRIGVRPVGNGRTTAPAIGLTGGVYVWKTLTDAITAGDSGASGVELYAASSTNGQLGIAYLRVDYDDSTILEYFDGSTPDTAERDYSWDGAVFLSAASARAVVATDAVPPTAPTALHITGQTQTSIALAWTAATDNVAVAGYNVYDGATKLTTTQIAGTTYNATALTPASSHTFTVTALDAAGNESPASAPVTGSTLADTAPSVPANLRTTSVSRTAIALAWDAATDDVAVTGYNLWRDGVKLTATPQTGRTYNNTGLTAGTAYSYAVEAIDTRGQSSGLSAALPVTTAAPNIPPSTPTNVHAGARSQTQIEVLWDAATDDVMVFQYLVWRNGVPIVVDDGFDPVQTPRYVDNGLSAGTDYVYEIAALDNESASSPRSSPATLRTLDAPDVTPPTTPTGLTVVDVTETTVTLAWDAATDNVAVTGYNIYVEASR
jgi:chitodextrinase